MRSTEFPLVPYVYYVTVDYPFSGCRRNVLNGTSLRISSTLTWIQESWRCEVVSNIHLWDVPRTRCTRCFFLLHVLTSLDIHTISNLCLFKANAKIHRRGSAGKWFKKCILAACMNEHKKSLKMCHGLLNRQRVSSWTLHQKQIVHPRVVLYSLCEVLIRSLRH